MTESNARRLTLADYDDILKLWQDAGLKIKEKGRDSREAFALQLAGTQEVIGLEHEGRLVGVAITTHDERKGWINRLAVHPDYRSEGLGLRLIEEAERVLREQGMKIIAVLIEEPNEASLRLFERAGYSIAKEIHYLSKRDSEDV